jgi:hypothetical protein
VGYAGGVEHVIGQAVGLHQPAQALLKVGFLRDIRLEGKDLLLRVNLMVFKFRAGEGERLGAPRQNGHAAAPQDELFGDGKTDAGGAAGDESELFMK